MVAELFSRTFKVGMRDRLMDQVLDEELVRCHAQFGPISAENAVLHPAQKIVGFYYKGQTCDSPGNWKTWAKRVPLLPALYGRADEVLAELQELKDNRMAIMGLITNALVKSKSVGDMFALMPDSYQPTMVASIVNYEPGSLTTLTPNEIQDFLDKHEPILTKFREYLMLRLLMG